MPEDEATGDGTGAEVADGLGDGLAAEGVGAGRTATTVGAAMAGFGVGVAGAGGRVGVGVALGVAPQPASPRAARIAALRIN